MSKQDRDLETGYHIPVLLEESLGYLDIKADGFYIDGTLGEGGHSYEIYKLLSEKGKLISLDQDKEAIDFVNLKFEKELKTNKWEIMKSNFSKINEILEQEKRKPNGILMDIGVSSRQLDVEGRGFSYNHANDLLDMRMDEELGVTALDLIRAIPQRDLEHIIREYGEEKQARRIARLIKENIDQIETVQDLNDIVRRAVPAVLRDQTKHPSRRVFQALRIVVNDELNSLEQGLKSAFNNLEKDGRLVIISFHSLEDRIVKQFFNKLQDSEEGQVLTTKPIQASEKELERNPRSRSAKLRAIKKL